jgi:hypothetical protein|tara:strand:- start:298 stop:429 length:132 start_codon:yes stop_codon:yes gene_type:complete
MASLIGGENASQDISLEEARDWFLEEFSHGEGIYGTDFYEQRR